MNLGTQRYVIMISVLVRNVPRVVRIRFEVSWVMSKVRL